MVNTRRQANNGDDPDLVEDSDSDDDQSNAIHCADNVILDSVLSYAVHSRLSSSNVCVKIALLQSFSGTQIKRAKHILWTNCTDTLGQPVSRRDTEKTGGRSVKEANASDILDALNKLESTAKMPMIAVLASDLHMVPKCLPEELNTISMVDRITRLEQLVSGLSSDVVSIRTNGPAVGQPAANPSITVPSSQGQGQGPAAHEKNKKKTNQKNNSDVHVSGQATQVASTSSGGSQGVNVHSQSASSDAPFTEPSDVIRKKQRQERSKRKYVTGTAANFRSMVGSEIQRHLFIYNVSPDAILEDVKDYITQEKGVEVKELLKLSKAESRNQSFRLSVKEKDYACLNDPAAWPDGVKVRRYVFPPRKQSLETSDSDNNRHDAPGKS